MTSINGKSTPPNNALPQTPGPTRTDKRTDTQVARGTQATVAHAPVVDADRPRPPMVKANTALPMPPRPLPGPDITRRHSEATPNADLSRYTAKQNQSAGMRWLRSFAEFDHDMSAFTPEQTAHAKELMRIASPGSNGKGEGLKAVYAEQDGSKASFIVAHDATSAGGADMPPEHSTMARDMAWFYMASSNRDEKKLGQKLLSNVVKPNAINLGGTRLNIGTDQHGAPRIEISVSKGYGNDAITADSQARIARFYGNVLRAAGYTHIEVVGTKTESRSEPTELASAVQAYVPTAS